MINNNKDTFDLMRVKSTIERHKFKNIIVISNGKRQAMLHCDRIKEHLRLSYRPFIVTNSKESIDGLPYQDSLILKIGNWWENKNACHVMGYSGLAARVLPISYVPPFVKGGDDD